MLAWKGGERERLKRRVAKPQARRPAAPQPQPQGKTALSKAAKPKVAKGPSKAQEPRAQQQIAKKPNKSLDLLAITIPDLDPQQPNCRGDNADDDEGLGELDLQVDLELT